MAVIPASDVPDAIAVFFGLPILLLWVPQQWQRRSVGAWIAFGLALLLLVINGVAFAVTGVCNTFVRWVAWECWFL